MVLVRQQDAVKMNFNLERREVDSVANFMRIYLAILQLAFFYNFIDEKQRDSIAGAILIAARKAAKEDEVLVSNIIYIISLRCLELSNFECWELIREVTSSEAAESLVSETKDWFVKRMLEDLKKAKMGYKKAQNLKNAALISTWKSCYKSMELISGCLNEGAKLELKGMHTQSAVASGLYVPLQSEKGLTYIDKMENYIHSLWIETSILVKFDAEKIMRAISNERKEARAAFQSKFTPKIEEARAEYNKAVAKLSDLEDSYAKDLKRIEEGEAVYEELLEAFEEEHPELDEDALLDAFDEYWINCPQYFFEDRSEVEKKFRARKRLLQEEINICRQNVDLAEDCKADMENAVDQPDDDVSLIDILNEYAIVFLFKEGRIDYPQNAAEKEILISRIPTKEITGIFLENEAERIHLSAKEMTYLSN